MGFGRALGLAAVVALAVGTYTGAVPTAKIVDGAWDGVVGAADQVGVDTSSLPGSLSQEISDAAVATGDAILGALPDSLADRIQDVPSAIRDDIPALPLPRGGAPQNGQAVSGTLLAPQDPLAQGVLLVTTRLPAERDTPFGVIRVGAGTGMVVDSDGTAITNHHVVDGAESIEVREALTGRRYSARVIATAPSRDVAVLELSRNGSRATGLTTVALDDDGVRTGEEVSAVGNGGGRNHLYEAPGRVIWTRASVVVENSEGELPTRLDHLIRMTSDVVPGYSGGPVFDTSGKVVGMTTAGSVGLGSDAFAVPIDDALAVVEKSEAAVNG